MGRLIPLPSNESDGSKQYWTKSENEKYTPRDTYYHEKLLLSCAEDLNLGGVSKDDRFDELPEGYGIFIKTRLNSKHTDRYLYGHPKGKFDSPVKFRIHFLWLMQGKRGDCECVKCGSKTPAPRSSGMPAARKQRKFDMAAMKKELTPPPPVAAEMIEGVQKYIDKLYLTTRAGEPVFDLKFVMGNPDGWAKLKAGIEKIDPVDHSCVPRVGELVLFHTEDGGLWYQEDTQCIGFMKEDKKYERIPEWQAGIVKQAPEPGLIGVDDYKWWLPETKAAEKQFVIEVFPDKETQMPAKQYKVRISNIRPYLMLTEMLNGVAQDEWPKNIKNAACAMNILGVIDPFRVIANSIDQQGTSQKHLELKVLGRSLWIGGEKIIPGDVVRLLPNSKDKLDPIDRALIVKEVGIMFTKLQAKRPTAWTFLEGRHITTTSPSEDDEPIITADASYEDLKGEGLPKCLKGYDWYDIPEEDSYDCRVAPDNVVGRVYERMAFRRMCFADDINIGVFATKATRTWARRENREHGEDNWWTGAPLEETGTVLRIDDQLQYGAAHRDYILQQLPNARDSEDLVETDTEGSELASRISVVDTNKDDSDSDGLAMFSRAVADRTSKRGSSNDSEGQPVGSGSTSSKKRRFK